MPSIWISGVREVRFTPDEVDNLRQYVLNGGMIICDSVYGSPWFYESALKVFDEMFPESRFRVLPEDHPLYHMVVDIEDVNYHCGRDDNEPFLEGLYIGSRVGVLVSRYGLGCGWQGNMDVFNTLLERNLAAKAYSVESARQIGTNLAPYILLLTTTLDSMPSLESMLTSEAILEYQELVRRVPVSSYVANYAARLARATRPGDPAAPDFIPKWVQWGCGPRAGQALLLAAKSHVLLNGRFNVSIADVRAFVHPVLRHRFGLNFSAVSEGYDTDTIIGWLLEAVPLE